MSTKIAWSCFQSNFVLEYLQEIIKIDHANIIGTQCNKTEHQKPRRQKLTVPPVSYRMSCRKIFLVEEEIQNKWLNEKSELAANLIIVSTWQ